MEAGKVIMGLDASGLDAVRLAAADFKLLNGWGFDVLHALGLDASDLDLLNGQILDGLDDGGHCL